MIVNFIADYGTRVLKKGKDKVVAVRQDMNVNVVRVVFNQSDFTDVGITLASAVKKVLYIDHSEEEETVKASMATGKVLDDGTYAVDWKLPASACDEANAIRFALEIQALDGVNITAAWFSLPCEFRVVDTLTDADVDPGEDPTETATNAERIAALTDTVDALRTQINNGDTGLAALAAKINANAANILSNTEDITAIKASLRLMNGEDTWEEFERDVKMGYAAVLYPIGTLVEVACTGNGNSPYQTIQKIVIGHDHDQDANDPNAHTVTLLDLYAINSRQFDAPEAFWVNDTAIAANTTVNFTIPDYDAAYGGNKTYQVTTAKAHPAGSKWCLSWGYQAQVTAGKVNIYDPDNLQTASESLSPVEGNAGQTLGTINGDGTTFNHIQRVRYGSNNYEEAGLRQWANSGQIVNDDKSLLTKGAKGFNWKPTHKFDMPPSYHNVTGYASWLDPDFVKIVKTCAHKNRTNTVYDRKGTTQAYTTYEKFFLLSQEEVGFAAESGITCGTVYDHFRGMTNDERKIYDISAHTTARPCWLRTPHPSIADSERIIYTDGSMYLQTADNGYAAVLACVI